MRISESILRSDSNNFTAVRLILASSVIYTHCYGTFHGGWDIDDTETVLGVPISNCAVDGFFFLSGFLVYPSLLRLGNPLSFLAARLARLWPGLALSVLALVTVGYFITTSPGMSYIHGDTLRFALFNLTFRKGYYALTGVMCDGHLCDVNGSLWTLPWEARCYLILAALGLGRLATERRIGWIVFPATVVIAAAWDFHSVQSFVSGHFGAVAAWYATTFHRLWPVFALGVAAYVFRHRIILNWWAAAALLGIAVLTSRLGIAMQTRDIFIGYSVLCLGLLTAKRLSISGHWPDYSYGMYIYGAPVMMAAHALLGANSHWTLAAETVLLTAPVAALSWHGVEKPSLDAFKRWRSRIGGPRQSDAPPSGAILDPPGAAPIHAAKDIGE